MARRLVVVGGGFAGLWSAAGAARAFDAWGERDAEVVLVNPDPFHVIRVRCYEADLAPVRIPLDEVLGPIGVRRVEARAEGIDPEGRVLRLRRPDGAAEELRYDRLVLAAGSALLRPDIPGVGHGFDVDSYEGAARLARHVAALEGDAAGCWTAVVLGAGLVGLEIACELPARLRAAQGGGAAPVRVVLLDHAAVAGAGMGAAAAAIRAALEAAGVEARGDVSVRAMDAEGVVLSTGERIAAQTVVLATGMRASPLAEAVPAPRDRLGRLEVDGFLAVAGVPGVFAAGDIASAACDGAGHATVMSCQHARPMGRLAGHNAACELAGRAGERIAFAAPDYVTVLDLGPWGAVYTAGWDRGVLRASGPEAKRVKQAINGARIYPPRDGDRAAILAAAAPVIQAAPKIAS